MRSILALEFSESVSRFSILFERMSSTSLLSCGLIFGANGFSFRMSVFGLEYKSFKAELLDGLYLRSSGAAIFEVLLFV